MLGPHPSRQVATQAGHRDTGTALWPACRAADNKAGSVLAWAVRPRRRNQVRGRSGGHSEKRRTGPRKTTSIPRINVPATAQRAQAVRPPHAPLPMPEGAKAAPPQAPPPHRGARGRRSPWQPRRPHGNAEAGTQGGWAAAEHLPPPARRWGAKGFLPWASGAAGEGGMQRGNGVYPTPRLGVLPVLVWGETLGRGFYPGGFWTCPWPQAAESSQDNAHRTLIKEQ